MAGECIQEIFRAEPGPADAAGPEAGVRETVFLFLRILPQIARLEDPAAQGTAGSLNAYAVQREERSNGAVTGTLFAHPVSIPQRYGIGGNEEPLFVVRVVQQEAGDRNRGL